MGIAPRIGAGGGIDSLASAALSGARNLAQAASGSSRSTQSSPVTEFASKAASAAWGTPMNPFLRRNNSQSRARPGNGSTPGQPAAAPVPPSMFAPAAGSHETHQPATEHLHHHPHMPHVPGTPHAFTAPGSHPAGVQGIPLNTTAAGMSGAQHMMQGIEQRYQQALASAGVRLPQQASAAVTSGLSKIVDLVQSAVTSDRNQLIADMQRRGVPMSELPKESAEAEALHNMGIANALALLDSAAPQGSNEQKNQERDRLNTLTELGLNSDGSPTKVDTSLDPASGVPRSMGGGHDSPSRMRERANMMPATHDTGH